MEPTRSTMLKCRNCGEIFERKSMRGRAPDYCRRNCRAAALRRTKQRAQKPISDEYDALVTLTSDQVLRQLQRVRRTARDWKAAEHSTVAVLEDALALRQEVDGLIAAAVLQARGRNVPWKQIAALTGVGANRAPQVWAPDRINRALARRHDARKAARAKAARERRATRNPIDNNPSTRGHQDSRAPRAPEEQLRMALSYLQRTSGTPIRVLAQRLGMSPSYVARLLAGERMAPWPVIADFVKACDGNPSELRPLWDEVHHRLPAPPVFQQDGAVARATTDLKDAIRGLYLAGACPAPDRIAHRHPNLTTEQVVGLVTHTPAPQVPDWHVVAHVVSALHGRPETILPLWQRVQVAQEPHWDPTAHPAGYTPAAILRT